ncbi:RING-H2 finger protein ATL7-like [Vigna unguiculata]|uniref:RING-type E3 ubiquitin transferase n=1 Tax=Vigna unguiculata TaxID=3917 RepID=A0A4D6LAJ4_VIGUN|nr:RING-H2 finger protein ATL7-like [Vigna unguiculata]QCD85582.1 E3 ubiquitin-protein ligase [Vigna unguiculata]
MSEGYSCGCSDSDSSCGCWSTAASAAAATRSEASTELRLYRAFIFCVPIFFTLILLFLFYLFYLRPRTRLHWITNFGLPNNDDDDHNHNAISTVELGLNKELREMLPIIVYKESFSVKDTQCSVCLLDYQSEDRLQQIPACGHTFHMSCIDLWLATHTTCPLCRFSLLTIAKSSTQTSDMQTQSQNNEEAQAVELSESRSTVHTETTVLRNVSGEVAISAPCIDVEGQNEQDNQ